MGKLRSDDATYLRFARRWWRALLPRLAPLTVGEGGPIAMLQLENEFGYFHPSDSPSPYLEVRGRRRSRSRGSSAWHTSCVCCVAAELQRMIQS